MTRDARLIGTADYLKHDLRTLKHNSITDLVLLLKKFCRLCSSLFKLLFVHVRIFNVTHVEWDSGWIAPRVRSVNVSFCNYALVRWTSLTFAL